MDWDKISNTQRQYTVRHWITLMRKFGERDKDPEAQERIKAAIEVLTPLLTHRSTKGE